MVDLAQTYSNYGEMKLLHYGGVLRLTEKDIFGLDQKPGHTIVLHGALLVYPILPCTPDNSLTQILTGVE